LHLFLNVHIHPDSIDARIMASHISYRYRNNQSQQLVSTIGRNSQVVRKATNNRVLRGLINMNRIRPVNEIASREINMSENTNETIPETPAVEPPKAQAGEQSGNQADEQADAKSCSRCGSCCKPHTSLIIAVIALILAGYAAFAASKGHDNTAVETHLSNLDSQIAGVNEQITGLSQEVESNRENLIQTKLKKALQSIQEIGNLAGEGTKAAISEVEDMLKTLTSLSEQFDAPAQTEAAPEAAIEPASEPATEPVANPETGPETSAPAENAQPESAQTEPASAPDQPVPAEPTTTTPDSSAADPAAATTEAAPADASPIAPTESQAATDSPPADAAPATEPSAPQAF